MRSLPTTLALAVALLPFAAIAALAAAPAAPSVNEVARIRIGGEARWDYMAVDSAHHRLYVSHASRTEVIDTRTDEPVGANPDAILYDPASHRVLTFNGKSQDVTLIDAATFKVVGTLAVGGKPEFAQAGEGGRVWFNIEDTGELAVLDPATATLVRRQALAPCESPSGLAVDDRHRLYAGSSSR